jgi:hypothetical protein
VRISPEEALISLQKNKRALKKEIKRGAEELDLGKNRAACERDKPQQIE